MKKIFKLGVMSLAVAPTALMAVHSSIDDSQTEYSGVINVDGVDMAQREYKIYLSNHAVGDVKTYVYEAFEIYDYLTTQYDYNAGQTDGWAYANKFIADATNANHVKPGKTYDDIKVLKYTLNDPSVNWQTYHFKDFSNLVKQASNDNKGIEIDINTQSGSNLATLNFKEW